MEENDVIQLLRYYRHNVMNHLQLIQGYIGMDKPEMVKEKLTTYNAYLREEQKLMNLKAPSFTLWLLFFNDTHSTIRMTYEIKIEEIHLTEVDTLLTAQCKNIFNYLSEHLPTTEYFEGHMVLKIDGPLLKASIDMNGDFSTIDCNQIEQLQDISQFQTVNTKTGMQCVFLLPLHNEVE